MLLRVTAVTPVLVAPVAPSLAPLVDGAGDAVVSLAALLVAFLRVLGRAGIGHRLFDVVFGAAVQRFVPSGSGGVHRVAMTAPSRTDV